MSGSRYRALRFVHPDLDPGQSGLCLSPRGGVDTVSEDDSVRQAVLLLLSTRKGERIMRPDYGCDIHRLAFSPNDDTTAAIAEHYVRQALTRWEPRIRIVELDAHRDPEHPNMLTILLEYQVRTTGQLEQLALSLDLTGETN